MLSYRAALPLYRATLTFLSGVRCRYRCATSKALGSGPSPSSSGASDRAARWTAEFSEPLGVCRLVRVCGQADADGDEAVCGKGIDVCPAERPGPQLRGVLVLFADRLDGEQRPAWPDQPSHVHDGLTLGRIRQRLDGDDLHHQVEGCPPGEQPMRLGALLGYLDLTRRARAVEELEPAGRMAGRQRPGRQPVLLLGCAAAGSPESPRPVRYCRSAVPGSRDTSGMAPCRPR